MSRVARRLDAATAVPARRSTDYELGKTIIFRDGDPVLPRVEIDKPVQGEREDAQTETKAAIVAAAVSGLGLEELDGVPEPPEVSAVDPHKDGPLRKLS